jgi:hypothetical protein
MDRSRARAGQENIGVNRVDGQRPDRWQSPIGAGALPPRPSIVAHEQAHIATCENGMRLYGMATNACMRLLSGNGARCRIHDFPESGLCHTPL